MAAISALNPSGWNEFRPETVRIPRPGEKNPKAKRVLRKFAALASLELNRGGRIPMPEWMLVNPSPLSTPAMVPVKAGAAMGCWRKSQPPRLTPERSRPMDKPLAQT